MSKQCADLCAKVALTRADANGTAARARTARLDGRMGFLWALLSGLGIPLVLSRCGGNCGTCGQCAPLIVSIPVMVMVLASRRAGALLVAAYCWLKRPRS